MLDDSAQLEVFPDRLHLRRVDRKRCVHPMVSLYSVI